jgi:hypothetical protein
MRLLPLFVLGLFLAGATGCVSMDEHKRLQTAFDQSSPPPAPASPSSKASSPK